MRYAPASVNGTHTNRNITASIELCSIWFTAESTAVRSPVYASVNSEHSVLFASEREWSATNSTQIASAPTPRASTAPITPSPVSIANRAYSGAASAENVMVIARCNTDTQPKARITSKAPIAATAQNSASNKSAP